MDKIIIGIFLLITILYMIFMFKPHIPIYGKFSYFENMNIILEYIPKKHRICLIYGWNTQNDYNEYVIGEVIQNPYVKMKYSAINVLGYQNNVTQKIILENVLAWRYLDDDDICDGYIQRYITRAYENKLP